LGLNALVCPIEGDPHALGARVVADFLYQDGWTVDFLGQHTPVSALLDFVSDREPDLLAVSVTLQKNLTHLRELVTGIQEFGTRPIILVGGPAFSGDAARAYGYGADAFAADAFTAVHEARRLCVKDRSNLTLEDLLSHIGTQLQAKRKQHGMSQQELADAAGLDRAYISGVERGKQNITIGAIVKLTDALEIPVEEILMGDSGNDKH
jgi:methylmalonyl-CoA mutase cobalamin-binding subunit/DNA-binding XRE family transcriptional regulator